MATASTGGAPPRPPRPGQGGFKLTKFPSQFEKSLFANFDRLYTTILMITIVFLFSFFLFLSKNAVGFFGYSQQEISDRTKKLIEKFYIDPEELEELEEEPEEEEEEKSEEEKDREDRRDKIKSKPKEQQQKSAADRREERRKLADARRAKREADAAKVASSAQLALITGGAGAEGEAVTDILGDVSSTNVDLDAALKSGSGIAVAKNAGARTRVIEGGRVEGGGSLDDLVSGIGGVGSTSLGKRSGGISFATIQLDEREAQGGRSAATINKQIQNIQKAVDQCFKRAKRLNPNLKGYVSFSFIISKTGQVKSVKVIEDTVRDRAATNCIKQKIQRMRRFARAKKDFKIRSLKFIVT